MNENEFKNYYQILGIDKSLIDYVIYDKKKDGKYENKLRNEASKDKKIKEAYEICKNKLCKKYEDRIFKLEKESKLKIGMIERGIENNTDLLKKSKLIGEKESFEESVKYEVKEIKEQFNKRLAEIKEAYEALKTDGARKLYDDQLKEKELEKKNEREFLDETAYTFFEMSEREIELRADTKNNKIIKEAYNKKVEKYTKVLNDISLNPKQRKRAEDILKKAEEKGEPPFIFILDNIEDPHNLGAIIRTANLAGAHGVIIPKRRAVGLTSTVAKTSAGALNYTPVAKVTNLGHTIDELKEQGMWFVCADMGGETMYNLNLTGPIGVVIGNEGEGVSRLIREKCDFVASIPMKGDIDSLNASVAAGVLGYEIVRQRLQKK